jgi:hypothetical protein
MTSSRMGSPFRIEMRRRHFRFALMFVLIAVGALSGVGEQSNGPAPIWAQHLDGCYLDSKGRLGQEGIASLSPREVAVYCVIRNRNTAPGLSRRSGEQTAGPYQVNVFFSMRRMVIFCKKHRGRHEPGHRPKSFQSTTTFSCSSPEMRFN